MAMSATPGLDWMARMARCECSEGPLAKATQLCPSFRSRIGYAQSHVDWEGHAVAVRDESRPAGAAKRSAMTGCDAMGHDPTRWDAMERVATRLDAP